jgi:hypothetical protein
MIETIKAREVRQDHLGHMITVHTDIGPHRMFLAQILAAVSDQGPTIKFRSGDKVTYPVRGYERVDVELPDPPSREVIVDRDEDGQITALRCPNPSCSTSDIAEVDQSIRWNGLAVYDGVIEVHEADSNHQHFGWVCQHCGWDLTSDLDTSLLSW